MNALRRYQQSRRDDMETLGYVWGHLYSGALPWAGMKEPNRPDLNKTKRKEIMFKKQIQMRQKVLSADWTYEKKDGSGRADILPPVLKDYMSKVMALDHEQRPDYNDYRQMIQNAASQSGIDMNGGFVNDGSHDL